MSSDLKWRERLLAPLQRIQGDKKNERRKKQKDSFFSLFSLLFSTLWSGDSLLETEEEERKERKRKKKESKEFFKKSSIISIFSVLLLSLLPCVNGEPAVSETLSRDRDTQIEGPGAVHTSQSTNDRPTHTSFQCLRILSQVHDQPERDKRREKRREEKRRRSRWATLRRRRTTHQQALVVVRAACQALASVEANSPLDNNRALPLLTPSRVITRQSIAAQPDRAA